MKHLYTHALTSNSAELFSEATFSSVQLACSKLQHQVRNLATCKLGLPPTLSLSHQEHLRAPAAGALCAVERVPRVVPNECHERNLKNNLAFAFAAMKMIHLLVHEVKCLSGVVESQAAPTSKSDYACYTCAGCCAAPLCRAFCCCAPGVSVKVIYFKLKSNQPCRARRWPTPSCHSSKQAKRGHALTSDHDLHVAHASRPAAAPTTSTAV